MRFKRQPRSPAESPQLDLVPMMDVLMSILTFFIISAMSLQGGGSMLNVSLPQAISDVFGTRSPATGSGSPGTLPNPRPLIVELSVERQIAVEGVPVTPEQIPQQIQAYLFQYPQGRVLLKADQRLPYADVAALLRTMREFGGDRVSLAIERAR